MKLNYPNVKDWAFIAPELIPSRLSRLSRLCGRVYGSEKFPDGTNVISSPIRRMIEEQGGIIVETKNSKYIIRENEVSKEYEEKMGNIWQRLITSINS